jgi:hypothetical protein
MEDKLSGRKVKVDVIEKSDKDKKRMKKYKQYAGTLGLH